ncbi:hypothetical protein [Prauserella cavernicola]|uniref:hypothetical protein n=1 Tax=Prauserella cavernicola TaxID=2800127 RepID=UPI001E4BED96|nr:hypothetical protein [Prauserella cavernicola]
MTRLVEQSGPAETTATNNLSAALRDRPGASPGEEDSADTKVSAAVDMLRRRRRLVALDRDLRPGSVVPVFPDSLGGWSDPSNTRRDLRTTRGTDGFAWVTSHVFRKTCATILDEARFTPRQIADQLGHARPSLTQDVNVGRKVANPETAAALQDGLGTESAAKRLGNGWP